MITRLMSDSVSGAVEPHAQLVAAYVTGFTGSQVAFRTHPNIPHVTIVQNNTPARAHVIDVESGAATPAYAARWAHYMRLTRQNLYPTVYVQESNKQAVVSAFEAIREPLPLFWVAAWDGSPENYLTTSTLPRPGDVVAHQYADPQTSGGNYDLSAVVRYWSGVDAMPYRPPGVKPTHDQWVWLRFIYIPDHYAPALRGNAWKVLTSHPAQAEALVDRYGPADIR